MTPPTRIVMRYKLGARLYGYFCDNHKEYSSAELIELIGISRRLFYWRVANFGTTDPRVFRPADKKTIVCESCGKEVERKGASQKYCKSCAKKKQVARTTKYRAKNRDAIAKKRDARRAAEKACQTAQEEAEAEEKREDRRRYREWYENRNDNSWGNVA